MCVVGVVPSGTHHWSLCRRRAVFSWAPASDIRKSSSSCAPIDGERTCARMVATFASLTGCPRSSRTSGRSESAGSSWTAPTQSRPTCFEQIERPGGPRPEPVHHPSPDLVAVRQQVVEVRLNDVGAVRLGPGRTERHRKREWPALWGFEPIGCVLEEVFSPCEASICRRARRSSTRPAPGTLERRPTFVTTRPAADPCQRVRGARPPRRELPPAERGERAPFVPGGFQRPRLPFVEARDEPRAPVV